MKLDKPILAPLAGISDYPFKKICGEFNCGVIYSEMISVTAIHYKDRATLQMLTECSRVRPVFIQLFGDNPQWFADAVKDIEKQEIADGIDINFGCPVKKVIRNHAGSILMDEPDLCAEIVETVRKSTQLPLSVKFRSGFSQVNFLEFGKKMESSGADFLVLHPRTRNEMFSGRSDWNKIKILQDNVSIPVIGSGDIKCGSDYTKMLAETGCHAGMIGRGTYGNPWIFEEVEKGKDFLKNSVAPQLRAEIMKKHLEYAVEYYGEYLACILMRKHLCFYSKGIESSSEFRHRVNQLENVKSIVRLIDECII